MQAAYYKSYGPASNLQVGDQPKPSAGDNEALIAVRASALNPVDYRLRNGEAKLVMKKQFPRIPGSDFAGEVVESNIDGLRNGQQVFGFVSALNPGGSHARFVVAKPHQLAPKPRNLLFEEAAALPLTGVTAIQALRDQARLQKGQQVLINGCCGGVGVVAVQYAKYRGAHVTGVCSTAKVELAHSLGADHVIDYKQSAIQGKYDVIFDTIGNLAFGKEKQWLHPAGRMVNINPLPLHYATMVYTFFTPKKFKVFLATPNRSDLGLLKDLAEANALRPIIDREFPLERIQEAYQYLEEGHASGKVVIS